MLFILLARLSNRIKMSIVDIFLFITNFSVFSALIDVTEKNLIRDVLFIFQGIEGNIIKMDSNKDGYRLDPKVKLKLFIQTFIKEEKKALL